MLVAFVLLEDSPQEDDLLAEADSVACWALAEDELVAKLSVRDAEAADWVAKLSLAAAAADEVVPNVSDLDALAARLALDDLFAEALSVPLAAAAPEPELDVLLVPLPASAPSLAVVVLLVVPVPAALLGVLEEVLVLVVVPPLEPVPFAPAAAKFAVLFEVEALLLLAEKFADAPRVAAAELDLLAFNEAFAAD
jgi:hypothetical protein